MTAGLTHCPICGFQKFKQHPRNSGGSVYLFQCDRCGEYETGRMLLEDYQDVKRRVGEVGYILSGLARELFETEQARPLFTVDNIDETLKHYLIPNVNRIEEKIQKLLLHLRAKTEYFGQEIELGDVETVVPLAYTKNSKELIALFSLITEKKLAKVVVNTNEKDDGLQRVRITLSANGWDITNSLEKKNKESEQGFVAIQFDLTTKSRIIAIKDAIAETGYKPICIEDEIFSEKIFDKALGEIRKSRFVVVDLTGDRGSVFFEAGFTYGLGIEIIYVYKEGEDKKKNPSLEFYARHHQCYKYIDEVDLKEKVKNAINGRITK